MSIIKNLFRARRFLERLRAIQRTRNISDPDSLLRFFEAPSHGTIFKPLQRSTEIRELFLRLQAMKPRALMEIGTNNGGTLLLFCRAAAPDATVISLDLPGGMFGGGYSLIRVPYYKAFASEAQNVHLLRMDSHSPQGINKVRGILGTRQLDFLFIDGDHSYAGVKQDFLTYGQMVRPGGLIALHDIVTAEKKDGGEVPRFWIEIREMYSGEEIIERPDQQEMGIGLLRVPAQGVGVGQWST